MAAELLVYVGTYTRGGPDPRGRGEGIYVCRFDTRTGELTARDALTDVPNPSFLAVAPDGRRLYAVNELAAGGGAVDAFAVDERGRITALNRQPSHGDDPCHVSLTTGGELVLVANYSSGSVAVFPVGPDGALEPASEVRQHVGSSVDPERQARPHAHQIVPDPSGRFALVNDLGLDRVCVYRLDKRAGRLMEHEPVGADVPPGSGPRHLAFHPTAPVVYVINELGSTVTTCRWDAAGGRLAPVATVSTLPVGWDGANSCADIHVHPSGRFVYGSNRGHDSIAVFAVDGDSGRLTPAGHVPTGGREPRNFALDPSGRWLLAANQHSDTIVTFAVDGDSGSLTETGAVAAIPSPVCVVFAPAH